MKTLFKFAAMAIVLMCAILISCNKEKNPVTDPSQSQLLKNGEIFTVSPSGNYVADSYNIREALNNAVVSNDQIGLVDTMGGIYGESLKDAMITNNKVSGTSLVGIYG